MEQKYVCYQCQETAGCTGCTKMGGGGKTPHVAALQDLLVCDERIICSDNADVPGRFETRDR